MDPHPNPADYDDFVNVWGRRYPVHLPTARIVCRIYRWIRKNEGSNRAAALAATAAYWALHPKLTDQEALDGARMCVSYGWFKAPWYMKGQDKPTQRDLLDADLVWASKPPTKGRRA